MSHGQPKRNKLMDLGARPLNSEINVTPFVDVCLVLLIIFMVVTPMLGTDIPVELPITINPEKTEVEEQLNVFVKGGQAYMGGAVFLPEDMDDAMKAAFEEGSERQVAVQGDANIKYGDVMAVLRGAREAGFERVGLITEPEDRQAATKHMTESGS